MEEDSIQHGRCLGRPLAEETLEELRSWMVCRLSPLFPVDLTQTR